MLSGSGSGPREGGGLPEHEVEFGGGRGGYLGKGGTGRAGWTEDPTDVDDCCCSDPDPEAGKPGPNGRACAYAYVQRQLGLTVCLTCSFTAIVGRRGCAGPTAATDGDCGGGLCTRSPLAD